MTIADDFRYALRVLGRSPAFVATALAALALGIGANTAIFSVFNALVLRSLPYRDPQTIVAVWEDASTMGFPRNTPAPGNYSDWRTRIAAFEDVAAADTHDANLTGEGEPEKIGAAAVTYNLFSVLGVQPYAGRLFFREEDIAGANRVVLLSYGLWLRRFGGDRSVIGHEMQFNGANFAMVGVKPLRFQYPFREVELWTPAGFSTQELANRGNHCLSVVARLRPGVTLVIANEQLHALADTLKRQFPGTNRFTGMYAVSILNDYLGDTRLALNVLFAAVAVVLLIACANLANLLLARASTRRRELGEGSALGAERGRIVRELVVESLLLSFAGGLAGLLLARFSFSVLRNLIPQQLGAITGLTLDGTTYRCCRALMFTAAASLLTGLFFELAPAWRMCRKFRINGGSSATRG
jgi:putative ABC transport system permease protein